MAAFRVLLAVMFAVILVYTGMVGMRHGWNLLPVFFGDIAARGWPGQFNLDFLGFLTLSALWLAWRHHFRPAGLGLALLGFFGGSLFLSAYLWVLAGRPGASMAMLMLGPERAAARG